MEFEHKADGRLKATKEQKEIILSEIRRGVSPAEVARKYGLRIQLVLKWRRLDLQAPLNEALNPQANLVATKLMAFLLLNTANSSMRTIAFVSRWRT